MKWFRFWNDTINDVKILQLSDYEYRMWTYLLSYASETDCTSGHFQVTFKLLSLHFHQRFNLFSHAIETFQRVGLIDVDVDGFITITNWSKRQFKSDDSYVRVKKHREVNQKRNVSVTAPESDTESDTERKKEKKEKIQFIDNHFLTIPNALMNKWREVAPGIIIADEIKKAELWLLANPQKRRTRYETYLSNWMVRAQENFIKYGGNNGGYKRHSQNNGRCLHDREIDAETDRINAEYERKKAEKAAAARVTNQNSP